MTQVPPRKLFFFYASEIIARVNYTGLCFLLTKGAEKHLFVADLFLAFLPLGSYMYRTFTIITTITVTELHPALM